MFVFFLFCFFENSILKWLQIKNSHWEADSLACSFSSLSKLLAILLPFFPLVFVLIFMEMWSLDNTHDEFKTQNRALINFRTEKMTYQIS